MNKSEGQTERNAELKAKAAILQQQQIRLLQDVKTNEDKTKALEAVMGVMHKDMSRMNELIDTSVKSCRYAPLALSFEYSIGKVMINQFSLLHSELQNTNFIMEKEFVEELKVLEAQSVEADRRLQEVKNQKAQVLSEPIWFRFLPFVALFI